MSTISSPQWTIFAVGAKTPGWSARCSHERILTVKSPTTSRIASPLSVATEGDDETYHQKTAFRFTIDRSKNDAALEAERGTNDG
jgi:hypothetical protein